MNAVKSNLLALVENLKSINYKYEFEYPQVDRPDLKKVEETIRLLSARNISVPPAVLAFYQTIGIVEFSGPVPTGLQGCNYPDPISLAPFDPGYMQGELEVWDDHLEEVLIGDNADVEFGYLISGDHIHKAGFSGGSYYLAFLKDKSALMICNEDTYSFCEYLKLCNDWGGFPGLRKAKTHNWPIERLKDNFIPLPEI